MPAFRDPRSGLWRYRTRVRLPDDRSVRIGGPSRGVRTKKAAEVAERAHIFRLQNPGAVASVDPGRRVPTIEEWATVYLASRTLAQRPGTRDEKHRILQRDILPEVGALRLDELRQTVVDVLRAKLAPGRDPKTLDNIMSVLSGLVRYARLNQIADMPPMKFVLGKAISRRPYYALELADVDRLMAATEDQRYRVGILLAYQAGLRNGEIRGLRWPSINMLRRTFVVERALDVKQRETLPKHDRIRALAMSDDLWKALRSLPQRGATVLTTLRGGRPLTYWATRDALLEIYARAGVAVPEHPWHALRHSFGTELARAGTPINVIQDMMGHASIETTRRYMHTREDDQRDALARTFAEGGLAHRWPTDGSEGRRRRGKGK